MRGSLDGHFLENTKKMFCLVWVSSDMNEKLHSQGGKWGKTLKNLYRSYLEGVLVG